MIAMEMANIFMTGGAGTLGKALARRRREEGWKGKLTIFSTDAGKHNAMRQEFTDATFIQGDIRDSDTLGLAMAGHDVVIHAAAVKFIPDAEFSSMDTIGVNVYGSEAVCAAARWAGVRHVLGISTDKACHPANAYGASKMLMEKIFQEHARYGGNTIFNLVRYGNVLESRGSVIESWRRAVESGGRLAMTNPGMTRFWLSPSQAVDFVIESLKLPSGMIYIPKAPGLSVSKLFLYAFCEEGELEWEEGSDGVTRVNGHEVGFVPMRPGEKLHETLLTCDELDYAEFYPSSGGREAFWVLHPTTDSRLGVSDAVPYTSDAARELTRAELLKLLAE